MVYIVVAMFDKASAAFNPPQCVPAAGAALRQFEDLVNGEESVFTRHPEHFELYQIATFDDRDASYNVSVAPFILANGASLRREAC